MRKEICIKNQVEELDHVAQFIEEIGEELSLDMELQMNLNLVLEEMVSNIIFYAYPEGTEASIELTAESDGKELTFVLSDQGQAFDPTLKEDTDMDVNPAERDLGLMFGLALLRLCDEVWVFGDPSPGMKQEIEEAKRLHKPVKYKEA